METTKLPGNWMPGSFSPLLGTIEWKPNHHAPITTPAPPTAGEINWNGNPTGNFESVPHIVAGYSPTSLGKLIEWKPNLLIAST